MKLFKFIKITISGFWYFGWGRLISIILYDKKYLESKYFKGNYKGIFVIGWEWVIKDVIGRLFLHTNRGVPWPISPMVHVGNPENIHFHPDDLNNFQGVGKYFQGLNAKITIGRGTFIGDNVGLITANHDLDNLEQSTEGKEITIGEKCWIGMNSVILPGVVLGPNIVVGAGSIVTKSFPNGYCVIAGNPAKVIKYI